MIERSTLMEMFQLVESQGLSTKQELLWGYFFIDKDPEKLQAMVPELEAAGYNIVDLYEPGEGPEEDDEEECDEHHDHGCDHEHKHEHKHEAGASACNHEHGHSHKHECGLEHEHKHEHKHECGHEHKHEHKHETGHEHSHEHKHECGHGHEHEHEGGHEHGAECGHEHEHESHDEHCDHEHDEDEDDEYYCLHIEKAEQHSIDSLDARNKEFAALALKYGIEGYDGMDVGPVDGDDFEADDQHEHGAGCNH